MGESFSKQIDNFVFIFYPKAWTMPNMAVRHVHNDWPRNTYSLDAEGRCCTYTKSEPLPHGRGRRRTSPKRCEAKLTDELKRQAVHEMLGLRDDGKPPAFFNETVTFKTKNVLTKLSPEWYVRRYKNQYTKGEQRWVFYHDCLKRAEENTFIKGQFDFLMPYFDLPWACQVCGTKVPTGLQMVSKLTKANIKA